MSCRGKVSHGVIPGPHHSLAVLGKGLGSGPRLSAPQQQVRAQARGRDQQPLSRLLQAPRGTSCFPLPGHCSQTFPSWKNLRFCPFFLILWSLLIPHVPHRAAGGHGICSVLSCVVLGFVQIRSPYGGCSDLKGAPQKGVPVLTPRTLDGDLI